LVVNADSLFFCKPKVYADFYKSLRGDFGARFLCSPFVYDHKVFGALWAGGDNKILRFGKSNGSPEDASLKPMHNIGFYFVSQALASNLPAGESKIFDALGTYVHGSYGYMDPDALWFETGDINSFKSLCVDLEKHFETPGDWLGEQISDAIDFWNC